MYHSVCTACLLKCFIYPLKVYIQTRDDSKKEEKQTEKKLILQKIAVDFDSIEWNFVLVRGFEEFIFQIKLYKLIIWKNFPRKLNFNIKLWTALQPGSIIFDFSVESFVNSFVVNNEHYFLCFVFVFSWRAINIQFRIVCMKWQRNKATLGCMFGSNAGPFSLQLLKSWKVFNSVILSYKSTTQLSKCL